MKYIKRISAFAVLFCCFAFNANAQCESIAEHCESNLSKAYISDGQLYRALLHTDQIAEFETTFFGGSTYRIAACSGTDEGNLIFRVYDEKDNLLFTNKEYSNAPFWDFVVESTMNCRIEAELDLNKQDSGCAVLLIGFKQ